MARGNTSRRQFSDNTTTTFPKMGEWPEGDLLNLSGQRSPYTKTVGRKTGGRGKSPTGVKKNKGAFQIQEANGPRCTIRVPLYEKNAAEANMTQKNLRNLPAVMGDKAFGSYKQYGQTV